MLDRQRLRQLVVELGRELELVLRLVVLVDRFFGVAVAVAVRVLLRGGDQLGQHSGERVHLVAAQLRAGGEVRRPLRERALEAEQQRKAHLPRWRRFRTAGGELDQRVVECPPACRAGREDDCRVLVGAHERLAGPGFCAEGVGP